MRSPCLTLGPNNTPCHLAGQDKDNTTCANCHARVKYTTKNGCPCSYPDKQSLGHGGFQIEDLNKNYIPTKQEPGKHDEYIKQKCDEAGITVEELRRKGRKIKIRNVRRDIAIALKDQMTTDEIGLLIGVGYGSVVNYLKGK